MQSFNMDFILRDSMPRSTIDIISGKQSSSFINMVIEDKEETMLPDSSLSPSNQNLIGFTMDESKLNDTECMNKIIDKKEIDADVSLYNKKFKLVVDKKGKEYWVLATHLVPFVEVCKNPVDQHQYSITSHSDTEVTPCKGMVDPVIKTGHRSLIWDTFLYASQLALVEAQLTDLERELFSLDEYSYSRFINCGANLKSIPGQTFLPQVPDVVTSGCIASDTEINERDDARRIRLRQIIRKHSELKKWLSKIKKRLKGKNPTKSSQIVDFSSKDRSQMSGGISEYPRQSTSGTTREGRQRKCLVPVISNHDHSNDADSPEWISPEMSPRKYSPYIEKNIFSTILSLSKEVGDGDGIPMLTYEYDNYKANYKRIGDDPILVSSDGDGLNNQDPPTPDLRRAELEYNDISESIRVLVVQTDHLCAGVIHLANKEEGNKKMWRVTFDGDNMDKYIILSEWQLLEQGVREVIPTSSTQLGPGSRVCANGTVQLPSNLYPGTVTSSSVDSFPVINQVSIHFDDGSDKDVDLSQVRLLPENFPNLHELLKGPNLSKSNFYLLDRKNPSRTKRTVALRNSETGGLCYKESKVEKESVSIRKRIMKKVDRDTKVVVHWKLIKENVSEEANVHYELVRNIDNVSVEAGDSVQLLSYSRRHNYLANVVSVLARRQSAIMDIQCTWYYILADVQDHSDIIRRLKRSVISKKIIFKTNHSDIHDVYSVLRKVEVLRFDEYRMKYLGECVGDDDQVPDDTYVLAGRYNQVKTRVECLDEDIREYLQSGGH